MANASDCDDTDASTTDCRCTLTAVGAPTTLVSNGSTQGVWMTDPLETLGSGLIWELNQYTAVTTLTEFASQSAMVARTSTRALSIPYGADGTGSQVYDGMLYYNRANTNKLVQYDIATQSVVKELTLADAGFRNTYHYQWGGYSDIDFAVDEQGLWVIYGSISRSGQMVVAAIDPVSFTVTETYPVGIQKRTGNAFMVCGVLYAIDSYSAGSTTVHHAYDTYDGRTWNPAIPFTNAHGYNSSTDYNPTDGKLRSWDNSQRVIYSATTDR